MEDCIRLTLSAKEKCRFPEGEFRIDSVCDNRLYRNGECVRDGGYAGFSLHVPKERRYCEVWAVSESVYGRETFLSEDRTLACGDRVCMKLRGGKWVFRVLEVTDRLCSELPAPVSWYRRVHRLSEDRSTGCLPDMF